MPTTKRLKKAYRKKCKEYHPDLHPDDPSAEEHFKEVQAAYSEVMRMRSGGGSSASSSGSSSYYGQRSSGSSQQQYQDPFGFGFGFDPFGFGGTYGGASSSYDRRESPEMQAANNYIRNGYYAEAMNVLEGIAPADRAARWHYYAALASSGLGNNIRAQNEAPHRCGHGARQLRVPEPFGPAAEPRTGVLHLSAGIHPARQPPARHELLFAGLAVPDALQPVQHLLLRWARWILYLLSRG
mgnify:CR=1 FL=1